MVRRVVLLSLLVLLLSGQAPDPTLGPCSTTAAGKSLDACDRAVAEFPQSPRQGTRTAGQAAIATSRDGWGDGRCRRSSPTRAY